MCAPRHRISNNPAVIKDAVAARAIHTDGECDDHEDHDAVSGAETGLDPTSKRRRKLWMIAGSASCSLIGTCISPEDSAWLMRRLDPPGMTGAAEYDIHRYLVREAGRSGLAARLMNKRMDEKYSGMIKRFARETTADGLSALWEAALAEGKVAAAYWALLTHPQLDEAVMNRAFGDVHMLSHISGGETRKLLQSQTRLQKQVSDLEERLARAERAHAERVKQRDTRIAALEEELRQARSRSAVTPAATPAAPKVEGKSALVQRLEKQAEDLRRKVGIERYRARAAEDETRKLRQMLEEVGDSVASFQVATAPMVEAAPSSGEPVGDGLGADDLSGKSILYVGGRPHVLRHLKVAVAARNAMLLHHDGGMEQTNRSLEGMVERADIVVCPIDCISHDACLRVKSMCKQRCKPFLPLRNAGASSFQRALGLDGREMRMN